MPKPTLTELVRAIERSVTILEQQIKGIDACDLVEKRLNEDLTRLTVDFATVREKVASLEKTVDQFGQRRWTLFVAILSAFLGGVLTLLIQLGLRAITK